MTRGWLETRPIVVAVAGPNGAGKTTFHDAFLAPAALRFVNADDLARALGVDAYAAAGLADTLRRQLVASRESFVFETVFSDPAGAKLEFLEEAAAAGYSVVLCFVGVSSADVSEQRVSMRVSQGGHDVDSGKLVERHPRTMRNLAAAVGRLPHVLVYDNDDLADPFRLVAEYERGEAIFLAERQPEWLQRALAPEAPVRPVAPGSKRAGSAPRRVRPRRPRAR